MKTMQQWIALFSFQVSFFYFDLFEANISGMELCFNLFIWHHY